MANITITVRETRRHAKPSCPRNPHTTISIRGDKATIRSSNNHQVAYCTSDLVQAFTALVTAFRIQEPPSKD